MAKRAVASRRGSSSHVNLTSKQEAFCLKYIELGNAAEAYRQAYPVAKKWKDNGVYVQASVLLRNTKVKLRIAELEAVMRRDSEITVERVKQEWAKLAFSDMKDYATWGAGGVVLTDSAKLGPKTRAVKEISETKFKGERTITFKLHDKVSALDKLSRHLGLYVEADGATLAQGALALDAFREMVKAANTVVIPPVIGRGNGHA